jgi:PIN domain nuclease of toxin-antitoxin system
MLVWWFAESRELTRRAREAIVQAEIAYVSSASVWELAIKAATGKLKSPGDLETQLRESRFTELPITVRHAVAAAKLPRLHTDPFDRMLVAQAAVEGLTLLTSDKRLADYGVKVLLA